MEIQILIPYTYKGEVAGEPHAPLMGKVTNKYFTRFKHADEVAGEPHAPHTGKVN